MEFFEQSLNKQFNLILQYLQLNCIIFRILTNIVQVNTNIDKMFTFKFI